jgi:two-component system, LuxR family, sensor kinase FixL
VLKSRYSEFLKWSCYVISASIFVIDLFTPLGIADGVLYTIVIMLSIWIGGERTTLFAAVATSLLTLLGMSFSPPGEDLEIYITNRVFALISIWASTYVIIRFKQADLAATRNRDSLRALFEYATEGIIISNRNGDIVMANPQSEKQFGYESGELIGKPVDLLVPRRVASQHARNRKEYYHDPHKRYKGTGMELVGRRKDESEFPVEISLSHYSLGGEMFVIAFVIDITRRKEQQDAIKRANEELVQAAQELKQTNAELENFAYVSSHDLQEPLRKIQSFGDRIKVREGGKLSEEGQDYLDRMLNASARMQRLINDLLSFSRLTSQAQAFVRVDLNQVLTEVLSDLEIAIEQKSARIERGELPVIEAEPTQMRQLLQNLIGNALKFTHEGVTPRIRIYAAGPETPHAGRDPYIQLCVEDEGIGFDEKYHDKIFTIFQRLDGRKYEGSGIGLAICKKIANRHGGDIRAQSAVGKGTRFIVTLPLHQKVKNETKKELLTT